MIVNIDSDSSFAGSGMEIIFLISAAVAIVEDCLCASLYSPHVEIMTRKCRLFAA